MPCTERSIWNVYSGTISRKSHAGEDPGSVAEDHKAGKHFSTPGRAGLQVRQNLGD